MTDDGRNRPRVVDENPAGRRADSRRLRPVDDAPLPEKVGGSRRLNVIKPADAPPPPTTELPPAWLPPKADPNRPASRRIEADAPVVVEAAAVEVVAPPGLLARLEARTGQPRQVLVGGAAAAVVLAVVAGALVGGGPPVGRSRHFDDDAQRALATTWRREGPAGWGGQLENVDVVATMTRIGAALAPGFGQPVDVIVVGESGAVHGFALPDGAVVLTTGLLWRLQSEAEAAAVVAHLHAHHRLGQVAAALDEPADLAARAAAILAQAQPKPPSAELEVLVAVAAADATHAHAHTDELNADQRAADALVAAGYDRSALRSALARLAPPTAFAKMHPTSPARTAALATLPAGGRVDADRWTREVLARLDRRRGVTLAAATTPTTTTPTTTPTITPTTSAPTTVAPTSTSTPSRPPKKKPTKSPRRAPR